MSRLVEDETGFSVVEIILVIVVVILIVIVGWSLHKTDQKQPAEPVAVLTTTAAPKTSTTMTEAQAGETYLEDIAPANTAITTLFTQEDSWTKVTGQQAEQAAQPSVKAFQTVQSDLDGLATNYPSAAADLKTEAADTAAVIADLQDLSTLSSSTDTSLKTKFISDVNTLQAQANAVRADLGLPSTSSS